MTAIDEQTDTIEHLDFTPRCAVNQPAAHDAQWVVVCRGCGESATACEEHLRRLQRRLAKGIRKGIPIECIACHRVAYSLEESMEVLPL